VRNLNDTNAHLQKQLENVVREGLSLALHNAMLSLSWPPRRHKRMERSISSTTNWQVSQALSVKHFRSTMHFLPGPELERDLELERRKVRELQDSSRNQDKEYQKLKACAIFAGHNFHSQCARPTMTRSNAKHCSHLIKRTTKTPTLLAVP
jgi:hypothetical protein